MAYFISNALRESDFLNCRFLRYDNCYDIFQEKTILLHFEGTLERQNINDFVVLIKGKLDVTGIRYSFIQSFSNENNSVTLIVKLHDKEPRFIPEGAKPYSLPPSRARRNKQRQEEYFKKKNYTKPEASEASAHPGLGSLNKQNSETDESPKQVVTYMSSDSDAIASTKTSGCFSTDSAYMIERKSEHVRRRIRRAVRVAQVGCQTTAAIQQETVAVQTSHSEVASQSCQTATYSDEQPIARSSNIYINRKAVNYEASLIKWKEITPGILRKFTAFLRANEPNRIPAFLAFLSKTDKITDVEKIITFLPQDVDSEVLISILGLIF